MNHLNEHGHANPKHTSSLIGYTHAHVQLISTILWLDQPNMFDLKHRCYHKRKDVLVDFWIYVHNLIPNHQEKTKSIELKFTPKLFLASVSHVQIGKWNCINSLSNFQGTGVKWPGLWRIHPFVVASWLNVSKLYYKLWFVHIIQIIT